MAEAPADDNLCAVPAKTQVEAERPLDNIPTYVYISPSSLAEGRTHEAPRGGRTERREAGDTAFSSFGADIGASRGRLVERREAPGPTSLGSRASKAAGLGNQALP